MSLDERFFPFAAPDRGEPRTTPAPIGADAKHYTERDLEELGDYYVRHVIAMTDEALLAKSAIAAELGWRDREIDRLRVALASATSTASAIGADALIQRLADCMADPVYSDHAIVSKKTLQLVCAALASAAQPAVPPGYVLVPVEPTRAMIDAGTMHTMRADEMEPHRARGEAIAAYGDMLAAAPKAAPAPAAVAGPSDAVDDLLDYAMQIAHERELDVLGHTHDSEGAVRRFRAAVSRAIAALPAPAAQGASLARELRLLANVQDEAYPNFRAVLLEAAGALDAAPAAQGDAWKSISTLPTSDDPVWLYCQDSNTIDGPVTPSPSYVDSWTHWAPAEAPSTAAIDAARAQAKEGGQT